MRCAACRNARPARERLSKTIGSPLFVATIIISSSGTIPSRSTPNTSKTSATSIISPRLAISERSRLTIRRGSGFPAASTSPIMRSASRTEAISGFATMMISSAPTIALRNPCSMPAGESISTKSNSARSCWQSCSICTLFTAFLSRVWAAGSR